MKYTIFSKNNMGIALSLLTVLIIIQSKILHYLIDTVLGRLILVSLLLVIGYLNKFLGILVVLIIIIMMNNTYSEGMDIKQKHDTLNKIEELKQQLSLTKNKNDKNKIQQEIDTLIASKEDTESFTMMKDSSDSYKEGMGVKTKMSNFGDKIKDLTKKLAKATDINEKAKIQQEIDTLIASKEDTESFTMMEDITAPFIDGPDVLEMENTLKRGKNSNTMNVQHGVQNADNADPFYNSFFGKSDTYSAF
jgi:hypothetical protein